MFTLKFENRDAASLLTNEGVDDDNDNDDDGLFVLVLVLVLVELEDDATTFDEVLETGPCLRVCLCL